MVKLLDNIEIVEIDKLVPYINNPKEHPQEQIDKIASSIKNFGFTVPIVVDGNYEIVAGHGRFAASQKLDLDKLPIIKRDDLSKEEIKAFRIADNKVAESEWDFELLSIELEELKSNDIDLDITGFDEDEINGILDDVKPDLADDDFEVGDIDEDKPAITNRDDLIELGPHRLLCGDSTSREDVSRLMDGKIADMVFTDPPYNVDYEGQDGMKIDNDNMEDSEFYLFLYDFYSVAYDFTKAGGAIYVCHADSEGRNFRTAFEEAGWLLKQCLIWVKNSLVMGRQDYHWKHEPILYGWKPGDSHFWNGDRKQTTTIESEPGVAIKSNDDGNYRLFLDIGNKTIVLDIPDYDVVSNGEDENKTTWYFNKPLKNVDHPTMKPILIPTRAIKNSSKANQIILDPFGGSGSTLIAAEHSNRLCYMQELDEHYCDVIVRRYINFRLNEGLEVDIKVNGQKVDFEKYLEG